MEWLGLPFCPGCTTDPSGPGWIIHSKRTIKHIPSLAFLVHASVLGCHFIDSSITRSFCGLGVSGGGTSIFFAFLGSLQKFGATADTTTSKQSHMLGILI